VTLTFYLRVQCTPRRRSSSRTLYSRVRPQFLTLAMASSAAASRSTTPATAPDTQSSSESGALGNGLSKNGAASDDAPRLVNTTACLPFVYGSVAVYLGNKADDYNTHKWTLYLRGPNNEDLSSCIAKVVFQLHPSFAQPVRELSAPPFEVTEQGWGEFEAQIRIVWKDTSEKSTLVRILVKSMTTCGVTHGTIVASVRNSFAILHLGNTRNQAVSSRLNESVPADT
jgi:YEATS domain-containing protein 4